MESEGSLGGNDASQETSQLRGYIVFGARDLRLRPVVRRYHREHFRNGYRRKRRGGRWRHGHSDERGHGRSHYPDNQRARILFFPGVASRKYTIDAQQPGFKTTRRTDVILEVNDARVIDLTLQVGQQTETVEVSINELHVETSNTQMGEVIEGKQMTAVPLVTRSYTDLLALQPGVVPQTSGLSGAYAGAFLAATFAIPQVSGSLSAGQLSVNGQREAANGF